MPLSWRIVAVVGTIVGAWTSSHVLQYRAQAWANAPVEDWSGNFKATPQQLKDLHARERALRSDDDQQQHRDVAENPSQLDDAI
jgi:hypothetical protein